MKPFNWILVTFCLIIGSSGCNISQQSSSSSQPPVVRGPQAEELVGKWHLVRAGGKPPIDLYIKSQEIEIGLDGTWTSKIEVKPPQWALTEKYNSRGTWSLADGVVSWHYTAEGGVMVVGGGPNSGKSEVRVESGRLIVDPDFFMKAQKNGTDPVAGEYER